MARRAWISSLIYCTLSDAYQACLSDGMRKKTSNCSERTGVSKGPGPLDLVSLAQNITERVIVCDRHPSAPQHVHRQDAISGIARAVYDPISSHQVLEARTERSNLNSIDHRCSSTTLVMRV